MPLRAIALKLCFAAMLLAQAPTNLQPLPLSRPALFGLLFQEIADFDAHAGVLAGQGKSGTYFQHYHGQLFDLPADLESQLKVVAISCAASVQDFDRRAFTLIKAVKDKYRHVPRGPASQVPPMPAELTNLQQQRDSAVSAAVDNLAASFGPAQFALFEAHVRQYIGSHSTAVAAAGH
jgi:hypothetical protein